MAGLLAAEVFLLCPHGFRDVAVPDLGAAEGQAEAGKEALQAEIGHDGGDDAAAGEAAGKMHVARDQAEDLVAVDDFAAFIGEDDAVGIAVERDADIGAMFQHGGAEVFRRRWSRHPC